ncbi:hypothetical protein [Algisphaera agarilytica]|uniref:Uncharacterized protein n=1 Tax=Algisphaera agarilytica TaxID=1385975 RepID=A0A7X0LM65_9BACT|nr:hypothetical protein [Algisphaera agarilytica]MBB6430698.1 hypothetical protein [Algisphaera agarilytica]
MLKRYELDAIATEPEEGIQWEATDSSRRGVGLKGHLLSGTIAAAIVMVVASWVGGEFSQAEAAGATQIRIAEAQADEQTQNRSRAWGVEGSANQDHAWVFQD